MGRCCEVSRGWRLQTTPKVEPNIQDLVFLSNKFLKQSFKLHLRYFAIFVWLQYKKTKPNSPTQGSELLLSSRQMIKYFKTFFLLWIKCEHQNVQNYSDPLNFNFAQQLCVGLDGLSKQRLCLRADARCADVRVLLLASLKQLDGYLLRRYNRLCL